MENIDKGKQFPGIKYFGFDHMTLWVGNAKQAASFYCSRFGYEPFGYKGLETGQRDVVSHVIRQGNVTLILQSSLSPEDKAFGDFLVRQGDGVRDVAFTVEDARACYKLAMENGGTSVREPYELKDEHGVVVLATVGSYGSVHHTFVERKNYTGAFLPGFKYDAKPEPLNAFLPKVNLQRIDHVVGNQPDGLMVPACERYEKEFGFHRFWSVDDSQIHTEYSSLRSIVMADYDEVIKMPINEPAAGKKKSQIQEYVEYAGGAGVQHVAVSVLDIVASVKALGERGVEFLTIPAAYYDNLRVRLGSSKVKVSESLDLLQKYHILVDFDDQGYLLQIFTKPVEDRPTLFWEIIQRRNHQGFGAGNFKSLFESIELEQGKRGNL